MSVRYRAAGYEDHLLKTPPKGYDASLYSWAPRTLPEQGGAFGTELQPSMLGKMLTNQRYFGDDRLKGNRDYILSHPRERTEIRKDFMNHSLGFLYFIQTDGGMPQLGLSEDEFADNNNMPRSPYVREGRRFRGRVRLTENDVSAYLAGPGPRPPLRKDSIAIGDWGVESRRCRDEPNPMTNTYDGSMFIRTLRAPYQVPFGCLLPEGLDNLLVTTTISATHVAFCALRVEAVWAQTGAAAGIAASLAIRQGSEISDIAVESIQDSMLQQNYKLTYFSDVHSEHPHFRGIQWLALKGCLPEGDTGYCFFPENSATWGEFLEAVVKAFELPVSVTGIHFDTIESTDHVFRYAETLYDTASRKGVALFDNMFHPSIDHPADHLLPEPRQRWLTLRTEAAVSGGAAVRFLALLSSIVGRDFATDDFAPYLQKAHITRAEMADLLFSCASNLNTAQS
ncbi:FAD-dependent oxidoreductase [Shinella granuli]|uniref:FAD-dependent oxidoreductase n=1 Tax=Shinella granuli TaxID=323621 RepID=UPI0013C37B37|nr:FAD-dependent oxidoreductase [Shinella granuli]